MSDHIGDGCVSWDMDVELRTVVKVGGEVYAFRITR